MDTSMPIAGDEESGDSMEIPVQLATLAVEGTQPGVGDECTFTVKGKVTRIDGDTAYVEPETANDQPIEKGAGKPEDQEDRLQRMSMAADDAGSSPGGEDTSTY